jgi:hypothetical protein
MNLTCKRTHLKNGGDEDGVRIREAEERGVGCLLEVSDGTNHRRVLSACFNASIFFLVASYSQRALSGGYVRSVRVYRRVHGVLRVTVL